MSTPNPTPQPGRQTYMAPVADVYAAMVQMLGFNASFDFVHQDEQSHAVTFSAPNLNGLFTAKVVPGETAASSAVEMTAPIDAGETAQQLVVKFYKDLGDQLMAQTAVQATSAQTTVMSTPTQQTEVVPPVPAANTAPATPYGDQAAQGEYASHGASANKFAAMLTDNNPGKTSKMAIVALAVAAAFLIFGFVALGVHPPIALCIIFAVIAAVLCVVAYMKTQSGKEHGRLFTVIASVTTIVALILSVIGSATGGSATSAPVNDDCKMIAFPQDGISSKLPVMKNVTGRISWEYSDHMDIYVCGVSDEGFNNYVAELKSAGFTEDYEKSDYSYNAKNSDGDKVQLYYDDSDQELNIGIESSSYIKEQEKEQAEYEKKQAEEEANKQKDAESDTQAAEEQEEAEEEKKQAEEEQKRLEEERKKAEEEEKNQQEPNQSNSGGVTSSVKEALDSYESFMNKYCDFMEKYNSSSDQAGMMTEYLKMMSEYADMTKQLGDMNQDSWTDADLQYYLEVTGRVNQRLASVS